LTPTEKKKRYSLGVVLPAPFSVERVPDRGRRYMVGKWVLRSLLEGFQDRGADRNGTLPVFILQLAGNGKRFLPSGLPDPM